MSSFDSARDPRQNMFGLNKRGQFFVLSAVIIAAIIVSITSLHNTITTADAPKKFYYYSQQLSEETGSVVNYALYSDPTGTQTSVKQNLNDFLQQGITKTLAAYPDMEIFSCWTNASNSTTLICQNNGTRTIYINTTNKISDIYYINGSKDPNVANFVCPGINPITKRCVISAPITTANVQIDGKNSLTIKINGSSQVYNIPITDATRQRGQFYFIATLNTTGGEYVSQSNDPKTLV